MPTSKKRRFGVMCTLLIFFFFGCAGLFNGNFGTITPDRNVTHNYETYQVNPNFNYYISGSDIYPNAIIGIDKRYSLDSTLWKKIEFTPQKLRILVSDMKSRVSESSQSLQGFIMLDPHGNIVGNWYSILSARTTIKMGEDNKVIVFTPDLETYKEKEHEDRELH